MKQDSFFVVHWTILGSCPNRYACLFFLYVDFSKPLNTECPSFRTFAGTILKIIYGVDIKDLDHEYVRSSQIAMEGLSLGTIPGVHWIEFFPSLSWIPSWVPGATFKKIAEKYRPSVDDMVRKPFEDVRNGVVSVLYVSSHLSLTDFLVQLEGIAPPSIVRTFITGSQNEGDEKEKRAIREGVAMRTLGIAYAGKLCVRSV